MPYSGRMPDGPLIRFQAVTALDATVYDPPLMLLRCGGAGNLAVKGLDDVTVTITGVLAGEYVPGPIKNVMAASTVTNLTGWKNE